MVDYATMDKTQRLAMLKALFSVIVWGASFVATKIALQDVSPVTVVWLRFAMGVIILGGVVWVRKQLRWPESKDWLYFGLLGFLGIAFHQWLQSTGLVTARAVTTGWIVASTPIFMALLSWLFLKEKLTWLQVLGIGLAAFGVLLVITKGDLPSLFSGHFGSAGDFLILISAPNWAIFSTLSRRGLQKYPAARMMFYVMSFGWLFSSILFLSSGKIYQVQDLSMNGWLAVSFLGIFCSGIAYIFWYDALQALPVAQTGAFLYIEPVITVIVAGLVLGEAMFFAGLLGGAIILCGVWMVNRKTLHKKDRYLPDDNFVESTSRRD
jgi:drug/metabolite transporter (DMT)-like permease